jgi:transcriptional repressor NrdR
MRCPFCHFEETKVIDSRTAHEMNSIKRRRQCLKCQERFNTFESVDLTLQVKKRDGSFQNFCMQKLTAGLESACRHTRVGHQTILNIASEVVQEIIKRQAKEIETIEIGELVMKKLKGLDPVAYVRFACVYRRFKDKFELIDAIDHVS